MIKVVSEEEIALTESLGYQPVFVERRKIQNFDEQNIAMMQYFYEYGVYPDVQEINSKLGTGTFDWNQDHALFREAMYTPNKQKRNKLLKQVLKLNPDYFAAEYHLFLSTIQDIDLPTFKRVLKFETLVLEKWKINGYNNWNSFEARPILTALMFLIEYYMAERFYYKALEMVNLYLSKQPERFLLTLFSVCSLYIISLAKNLKLNGSIRKN